VLRTQPWFPNARDRGQPQMVYLPKTAATRHLSDWRRMQETEATLWHPAARLFRHKAAGDWADLVERAGRRLAELR
jgi:hypothetical protein